MCVCVCVCVCGGLIIILACNLVLSKAPIGQWHQQPFILSGDRRGGQRTQERRTEDAEGEERGGEEV